MKINSKTPHSSKHFHIKKISFNGLLNSEYFFHRSASIKLALNQDRVLRKNYYVKRAKSKLDLGRKSKRADSLENEDLNISQEYRRNKTRIPTDLYKVIIKYGKKFFNQSENFHNYKNENDAFMSYWHYINDLDEKKERKLMLEKYFDDSDRHSINFYTKEIKNMCENMFKTNPLLTRNKYIDIFFYYLNEFNKNYQDKKKVANIKQKMKHFLEKLKDLLNFVEVIKDTGLDSITKDIRMKNSRYIKEYEEKVAKEKAKNEILQRKDDIQNIKESKKMIKNTSGTLFSLERKKNIFEDDSFPLDINSKIEKSRHFLSPNKTPYSTQSKFHIISDNKNNKMNSTSSTAFYLSGKGFYTKKNTHKKLSFRINDKNDVREESNEQSSAKKNKFKFYSFEPIKITKNRYSLSSLKNKEKRIDEKKNSIKKSDNKPINKNLPTKRGSVIAKINKDEIKGLDQDLIKADFVNNISRLSNLKHPSLKKLIENYKENKRKTIFEKSAELTKQNNNELVNMKKALNKSKSHLMLVYDNIKNRKKLEEKDKEDMKNYFVKKGKMDQSMKSLKSVYTMDIIKQAKIISDKMDIEQRTKKVFQAYLSYEQIKHLEGIRDINKKLKGLDIEFIKHIVKYKTNKND